MIARRGRWSSVVLSALCFAALACSGGGESKTAATGDSAKAGAGGAAGKAIKIAMIAKSSDNPVFLAARTGLAGIAGRGGLALPASAAR